MTDRHIADLSTYDIPPGYTDEPGPMGDYQLVRRDAAGHELRVNGSYGYYRPSGPALATLSMKPMFYISTR